MSASVPKSGSMAAVAPSTGLGSPSRVLSRSSNALPTFHSTTTTGAKGPTPPGTPSAAQVPSVSQLQQTINTLNRTVTELRLTVDEMERERDFYFEKLREIEIATQKITESAILDSPFFKQVTEILYKTDDDNFVDPQQAVASEIKPSGSMVVDLLN